MDVATVTLKKGPEELIRMLKQEAKQNRRSLNKEALVRLEASLVAPRRGGPGRVEALRRLHKRFARLPPITDSFLAKAKGAGRP
jgi:Antitoxin FitA-like, ribbon-helix-helix